MKKPSSIIEAIESLSFFGAAFKNPKTWQNWMTLWKAVYGLEMAPDELEMFRACTGRQAVLQNGYREIYTIAGRRSGKTRMAATLVAYEALWGGWEQYLAQGERAYLFLFAVDKTQASVAYNYVRGLLEFFPDEIEKVTSDEIQLKNRCSIMIKTSNYASSRGFSTAVVVLDELAFYPTEQYASPAEELVTALLPSLLPGGFIFGASTPYARFRYLFDAYETYYGQDTEDVLIWKAGTRTLNPTFSDNILTRLFKGKLRRAHMETEINAEFRSDIEAFLPDSLIKGVMTRQPTLPESGRNYFAFLDPSGGRVDSMTLGIAHVEEEDGIVLDRLEEFTPPFSPEEVVAHFSGLMKSYGISRCTSDRFGGSWIEEPFRKQGIVIEMAEMTASELYLEFQVLVSMNKVKLLDHEKLYLQLRALERRCRSGGRDQVTHPEGGHDDLSNACAGVCVITRRQFSRRMPAFPVLGPHGADKLMTPSLAAGRRREEIRASCEDEMRDFMVKGGANQIVRPGMRSPGPWSPMPKAEVGKSVNVAGAKNEKS